MEELEQVYDEDPDQVVAHLSSEWHARAYHTQGGTGQPPAVYRYGDKVHVDIESLPREQQRRFMANVPDAAGAEAGTAPAVRAAAAEAEAVGVHVRALRREQVESSVEFSSAQQLREVHSEANYARMWEEAGGAPSELPEHGFAVFDGEGQLLRIIVNRTH